MMKRDLWSTEALAALSEGNVRKARELSGLFYTIEGIVVHGRHLGRTLGFPTANIELDEGEQFIAAFGVYAVNIKLDDRQLSGIGNIGMRPTVNGTSMTIEIHIFDFSEDIYGKKLTVQFIDYLRPEKKFSSLDDLVSQIKLDIKTARSLPT